MLFAALIYRMQKLHMMLLCKLDELDCWYNVFTTPAANTESRSARLHQLHSAVNGISNSLNSPLFVRSTKELQYLVVPCRNALYQASGRFATQR